MSKSSQRRTREGRQSRKSGALPPAEADADTITFPVILFPVPVSKDCPEAPLSSGQHSNNSSAE